MKHKYIVVRTNLIQMVCGSYTLGFGLAGILVGFYIAGSILLVMGLILLFVTARSIKGWTRNDKIFRETRELDLICLTEERIRHENNILAGGYR